MKTIVRMYYSVSLSMMTEKNHIPRMPIAQIARVTSMSDFLPNFPSKMTPIPAPKKQLQLIRQLIPAGLRDPLSKSYPEKKMMALIPVSY